MAEPEASPPVAIEKITTAPVEIPGGGDLANAKKEADSLDLTGRFRGWLCNVCNLTIGAMKDDPVRLRLLAEYVERHNAIFRQKTPF